jgi:hypothetical protein
VQPLRFFTPALLYQHVGQPPGGVLVAGVGAGAQVGQRLVEMAAVPAVLRPGSVPAGSYVSLAAA